MLRLLGPFLAGLVFAFGLGAAGMTDPSKVIGFLNIAGDWNPALGFVMVGAIGVHALALPFILKKGSPLHGSDFLIPQRRDITGRLVAGAALFGAGWGLAGYCPGPALVSTAGGSSTVLWFVASMAAGMLLHQVAETVLADSKAHAAERKAERVTAGK